MEALRRYVVATPEMDDPLLTDLMEAAQLWLENAGVPRLNTNRLYDLAVYQLAAHWFDQRGVVAENGAEQIPLGVFSIMFQLQGLPPESEVGTG